MVFSGYIPSIWMARWLDRVSHLTMACCSLSATFGVAPFLRLPVHSWLVSFREPHFLPPISISWVKPCPSAQLMYFWLTTLISKSFPSASEHTRGRAGHLSQGTAQLVQVNEHRHSTAVRKGLYRTKGMSWGLCGLIPRSLMDSHGQRPNPVIHTAWIPSLRLLLILRPTNRSGWRNDLMYLPL